MTTTTQPDSHTTKSPRPLPTLGVLLFRGLRLRCPRCGQAPIFSGWFTMNDECAACGRRFNRDAGYLLGSIYFNYGVTASLVVIAYFTMFFGNLLTDQQRLFVLSAFAVIFPMWFFRYARSLWISFDEHWDPWPNEEDLRKLTYEAAERTDTATSQSPSAPV